MMFLIAFLRAMSLLLLARSSCCLCCMAGFADAWEEETPRVVVKYYGRA